MTKDDISKVTIPNAREFKLHNPQLNAITFYNSLGGEPVEVLRISKEGITANPDVPVDAAAAAVIRALDGYIKNLTQRPWVGLTEEEMQAVVDKQPLVSSINVYFKAIEAKLKELNT